MAYERNYSVHYYEITRDRKLSLPALLRYFEDIAIEHSERAHVGLDFYESTKTGWVLYKYDISIKKLPEHLEKIRIVTVPSSLRRFYGFRTYYLFNEAGEEIIRGESLWIYVDLLTQKPKRIREEFFSAYKVNPESIEEHSYEDIPKIDETAKDLKEMTIPVYSHDIDTNGHVNNVRYMEWALEGCGEELSARASVVRIEIHFRKAVLYGATVKVVTQIIEEENIVTLHAIKNGEADVCALRITWKKN